MGRKITIDSATMINKALEVMKLAGVDATAKRVDKEDCIEYTITIKNEKSSSEN